MKHRTDTRFDGLWPDERLISWHIPVRCRSGFDGQLPLPKDFVPDADAVAAIVQALDNADCHVVALVGAAGTGKTTALGWLLRSLEQNNKDLNAIAFRCSARTGGELREFLAQASRLDQPRIYIVDGFDELRAENPGSLDELLQPILSHLLDGRARIVFSVRPDAGRSLLVLPAENLLNTREWGDAWAGVETSAGLRVAILQLQELRQRDVELYAMRRKLSLDFVVHLRSLYDIRELVRRFFLLVKLCDLSEQLPSEIWKQIRARDELYERLLTTWLTAERERDPYKLPLLADDLLSLLEWAALYVDKWTKNGDESLITRLGDTIRDICESDRLGTYQYAIATALVNANIVTQVGFAHTSIEEYLLARALANLVRMNETKPLAPARITDDVIGFLAENKTFRDWLDQNQDRLTNINSDYLSYLVRLFHRQGRAVSNLDLHGANLSKLQLPGIRLKGADLRDANLEGTQFGPADLTGADLRGTDLRNAAIWTAQGASEMYASADGPDRVWLIHPSANRPLGVGMLIQLGFNGGRIAVSHLYDPRSERPYSDGLSLYLTPLALQRANVEVMQWRGENIANESWSLWPSATALASATLPGAVWQIRADRADLYNDDVLLQSFPHNNGSVRGVLAVPHTSEFIRHQVDGFCLIGAKLLALNRDAHIVIGEDIAFHQQMHQVATVGETRIIFRTSAGWFAWAPGDERSSHLPELADISRVIALSGGGYALVRPGALEFVDENLVSVARQEAKINPAYYIVGIKRERRRAIVILEPQGLRILDESTGAETVDWLRMRATGARFNKTTKLSNELRAALTSAGASNESLIPTAPLLENATTQHSQFAQQRFDVLLITVNQHEFDAVCAVAQEYFGKMPIPFPQRRRTYFDIGLVKGMRVGMVRSQMGSTQPGATTTTTLQAMYEVQPRCIIGVGIAFGIDPEKQSLGQILYSEKLQDYNLEKVGTDEQTKKPIIIPRGDKVSPNPTLLNRVQSAADMWRMAGNEIPISPILLLSGDTLVDNFDYREQLLTLFPEARGGEMEATGIYTASREEETPWIIIKAISDYADGKKRENKEERQKLAANNAARFVFYLIEQGGLAGPQQS